MTERTRRATEAVDAHYTYLDACRPGSAKAKIEDSLLDCSIDPSDVRYGHGDFLYGKGVGFQGWCGQIANRARTFTATTDLWREVALTVDMLAEEGVDWLPLLPHHVPAPSGFMLFPWGLQDPTHVDGGLEITSRKVGLTREAVTIGDLGGGDRYMIDGFLWDTNNKVARDGVAGRPSDGVTVLFLTRWRGRAEDRPFRMGLAIEPDLRPPSIVASDLTAWAFDDPDGPAEWSTPPSQTGEPIDPEQMEEFEARRLWCRSVVWATFRWLSEEVWLPESPHDRPTMRRMQRARQPIHTNPPPEDGMVAVVDLRAHRREAIAAAEGDGEPPWWRTRWIVRGHWARRRYAIRDDNGKPVGPTRGPDAVLGETYTYKRVWIEPHTKGPDSAPLVLRDRVGVLSR